MKKKYKNIGLLLSIIVALIGIISLGSTNHMLGLLIVFIVVILMLMWGFVAYMLKLEFIASGDMIEDEWLAFLSYALFINFIALAYSLVFIDGIKDWGFLFYIVIGLFFLYLASGKYFKDKKSKENISELLYSFSAAFIVGTIKSSFDWWNKKPYETYDGFIYGSLDILFLIFSTGLFVWATRVISKDILFIEEKGNNECKADDV